MENTKIVGSESVSATAHAKVENESKINKINTLTLPGPTKTAPKTKNGAVTKEKEREERETTKARKKIFLTIWEKTLGSVKATCEKTGIERTTYYLWMNTDPEFAANIRGYWQQKLEDVEQMMNTLILKGDGAMIRFFLDRRHPLYKPRVKVEGPVVGEKSLEQELDEMEFEEDDIDYGKMADEQLDRDSTSTPKSPADKLDLLKP